MGQVLWLFLRPEVEVRNHARSARSTMSFLTEGLWQPVEDALGPGDLLLVQFGHNDEKSQDPSRYSSPSQYAENLLAYCRRAQAKGAYPVIITPLTRRLFMSDGTLELSHGDYPEAARRMAAREGLPLIDLTSQSRMLVESLGEDRSRALYMFLPADSCQAHPDGLADNTHLRYEGAVRFSAMVAAGLRKLPSPAKDAVPDDLGPEWESPLYTGTPVFWLK